MDLGLANSERPRTTGPANSPLVLTPRRASLREARRGAAQRQTFGGPHQTPFAPAAGFLGGHSHDQQR